MTDRPAPRILIIGGGASGTLMACHLVKAFNGAVSIGVVERDEHLGRGVAYGTPLANHLLNSRAISMSAFPDEPQHFCEWLARDEEAKAYGPFDNSSFVPRRIYGRYLTELAQSFAADETSSRGITHIRSQCVSLRERAGGVAASLADGTTHVAELAILATGHERAVVSASDARILSPDDIHAGGAVPPDEPVLLVGTGLTMIDCVISLLDEGHRGTITAISRRGLLPHVHAPVAPVRLDSSDIPLGVGLSYMTRELRGLVRDMAERGHDWRSVIDGLRPHLQDIWQSLPLAARQRFLRHGRAWWDVHRHRLAPEINERLQAARDAGQLKIRPARFLGAGVENGRYVARIQARGKANPEVLTAGAVVACTGVAADLPDSSNPVIHDLYDQGAVRLDPLALGIEVANDGAIIGTDGQASRAIFAIGPLTRAGFWEITAIPEIRNQCKVLAAKLRARLV